MGHRRGCRQARLCFQYEGMSLLKALSWQTKIYSRGICFALHKPVLFLLTSLGVTCEHEEQNNCTLCLKNIFSPSLMSVGLRTWIKLSTFNVLALLGPECSALYKIEHYPVLQWQSLEADSCACVEFIWLRRSTWMDIMQDRGQVHVPHSDTSKNLLQLLPCTSSYQPRNTLPM